MRTKSSVSRKRALLATTALVASGMFGGIAYAVIPASLFELDGNAVDDPAVAGDDWSTLYTDPTSPFGNSTDFTGIVGDPTGASDTSIFTGGGSKDTNDVSQWRYTSGSSPAKADIAHAYAANYVAGGEQIIYFGADRFDNSGDTNIGFWFFQNQVRLGPNNTFVDENGDPAQHTDGDLLIVSAFTQGGGIATPIVFRWTGGPGGSLQQLPALGPEISAITNASPQPAPWPYTPKSPLPAGSFPRGGFFEGGINITQALGGTRCFASFLAETRSSQSPTSTLQDFALGSFEVCRTNATKKCNDDNFGDDVEGNITYDLRGCFTNGGGVSVSNVTLTNEITSPNCTVAPQQNLTWYDPPAGFNPATDCNDNGALTNATTNGTPLGGSPSTVGAGETVVYKFTERSSCNTPSDTVTITASAGTSTLTAEANDTCPSAQLRAGINVTKTCTADLEVINGQVVVRIDVSGTISAPADNQVTLQNVTLTDVPTLTETPPFHATSLAAGASTPYTGFYYPSSIPSGVTCPFPDTATATATTTGVITPVPGCTTDTNTGVTTCRASDGATCLLRAPGPLNCTQGPVGQ